ncbi:MAG: complex I subunit 5 family protein [Phycisphaerae bacterium]
MLPLLILVPLGLLVLLNLPYKTAATKLAFILTLVLAAAQTALVLLNPEGFWSANGPFSIPGFTLAADKLCQVLVLTVGIVVFVTVLVAEATMSDPRQKFNFINLVLVGLIGMNGVAMVRDLFTLYVFLEITAVASFVLIAVERGRDALEGAFKYIVLSAVASVLMLAAIAVFLMVPKGTTCFDGLHDALAGAQGNFLAKLAMGAFLCGLFIKGGLVPFHGWLPAAYSTAPAPVSVLLAGIATKVSGIYALIRLAASVFTPNDALSQVLMLVGVVSIVVGAVAALTQGDFKRVLAYSSISQMGYIVLGLGCASQTGLIKGTGMSIGDLALIGAVFHFFNHAIFKSLLFVNSAAVERSVGTTELSRLGGLGAKMPATSITNILAVLSTAGVPPLAGFWSKLMIIAALWLAGFYTYAMIAIGLSVVTLAYLLIVHRRVFFGVLPEELLDVKEAPAEIVLAAVVLGAVVVGVGVAIPFLPKSLIWPLIPNM